MRPGGQYLSPLDLRLSVHRRCAHCRLGYGHRRNCFHCLHCACLCVYQPFRRTSGPQTLFTASCQHPPKPFSGTIHAVFRHGAGIFLLQYSSDHQSFFSDHHQQSGKYADSVHACFLPGQSDPGSGMLRNSHGNGTAFFIFSGNYRQFPVRHAAARHFLLL